jgi:hypothetical protein
MADATTTYRRSPPRSHGAPFERYVGLASAVGGLIGIVAIFGSPELIWHYAREVLGTLYVLALAIAS